MKKQQLTDLHEFLSDAEPGEGKSFSVELFNRQSVRTAVSNWKRYNKAANKTFYTRSINGFTHVVCAPEIL